MTMAKPSVPDEYQDPFLRCRTFGHTWHMAEGVPESAYFFRCVLICSVCKARRLDVLNRRTGGVVSRSYEYQEGYQATRAQGLRRTTYRIEFIRRITR